MQINLQTKFNDGTEKVISAGAADLVAFEREFDLSVAKLQTEVKLTHLLYIAWHSESRNKSTTLKFDDWTSTIVSIQASDSKK
jgi:hypothetical protein